MSDGMRRELVYLSSYATNRYFIPNWGIYCPLNCYSYASLRNYGLSADHPYLNKKCIIRKGVLLSKSGNRGIRKQQL